METIKSYINNSVQIDKKEKVDESKFMGTHETEEKMAQNKIVPILVSATV